MTRSDSECSDSICLCLPPLPRPPPSLPLRPSVPPSLRPSRSRSLGLQPRGGMPAAADVGLLPAGAPGSSAPRCHDDSDGPDSDLRAATMTRMDLTVEDRTDADIKLFLSTDGRRTPPSRTEKPVTTCQGTPARKLPAYRAECLPLLRSSIKLLVIVCMPAVVLLDTRFECAVRFGIMFFECANWQRFGIRFGIKLPVKDTVP